MGWEETCDMCWCSVLIILGSVTKSHRIDFKVKGRQTWKGGRGHVGPVELRWVIAFPQSCRGWNRRKNGFIKCLSTANGPWLWSLSNVIWWTSREWSEPSTSTCHMSPPILSVTNTKDRNSFLSSKLNNEGINQRCLKIWANVADKICFGRT